MALLLLVLAAVAFGGWGAWRSFGPQPKPQPLTLPGALNIGGVAVPYQNLLILTVALVMMAVMAWLLGRTRMGRAIRATAQNREAARRSPVQRSPAHSPWRTSTTRREPVHGGRPCPATVEGRGDGGNDAPPG